MPRSALCARGCRAMRASIRSRSRRSCSRSAFWPAISRSIRGRWRSLSPPGSSLSACGSRRSVSSTGMLSALITCFGVSLLLRSDTLWVHPLAAALAISSKFVLRVNGKHVFNPANLGVIAALVLLPGTWVSPGQWGNDVALAGWFVALGGLVTQRARRWDISWVFLAAWLGLVAARVLCARSAVDDPRAPARERRAAAVRVLHDLGSDDDPEPAIGARRLRDLRRDASRSSGSSCCSGPTRSCGRSSLRRRSFRSSTALARGESFVWRRGKQAPAPRRRSRVAEVTPLRACAPSGIPSRDAAAAWAAPARSATAASTTSRARRSPTSSAPNSLRARPAGRAR